MHLLCISGSLRKGSLNTKLLQEAARIAAAETVVFADLDLPLFNADIQDSTGIPAAVETLAQQIKDADAVLIASPEYNQGITGVLKNALDWVSRVDHKPWADKPVALLHAAAGRTGGARANYALRLAMAPFNTRLIQGPEILVAAAARQFNDDGHLENDRYKENLSHVMAQLRAIL